VSWLPGEALVFDKDQRANIESICADLKTFSTTGQLPCYIRAVKHMNWLGGEIMQMTDNQLAEVMQ